MRLRQRVIDERSNGSAWQKNASPVRYWKVGVLHPALAQHLV
jgi:hypothetical protein